MEEFKEQGAHRRRLEAMVVQGNQRRANYGLVLGYIGMIALIVGGIGIVLAGYGPYGILCIGTAIATVLGVQAKAVHDRKQELDRKEQLVSKGDED